MFWWHSKVLLCHAFIITHRLFKLYSLKGVLVISQLLSLNECVSSGGRVPAKVCVKVRHSALGETSIPRASPSGQQQQLFTDDSQVVTEHRL